MTVASEFKHPPTPPAITGPLIVTLPPQRGMTREPVDFHSMSIGAVSVAELLEDSAA